MRLRRCARTHRPASNPSALHRFEYEPMQPKIPTGVHAGRRGLSGIWLFLGALVLALLVGGGCAVQTYNGLIQTQEGVDKTWAEVLNQYKRRFDLVPQLLETVKGAANFERDTITAVTEARAGVGRIQLPEQASADPAKMSEFLAAQQGLGSALSRLLVVAENYPELRAVSGFRDLQTQLEGTENRIAVARRDHIDSIERYNAGVRKFPGNLIARMSGFERLQQLAPEESRADLTTAPKLDFGD